MSDGKRGGEMSYFLHGGTESESPNSLLFPSRFLGLLGRLFDWALNRTIYLVLV